MKLPSKQHISITAVISVLTAIIVFLLTQIWNYGVEWNAWKIFFVSCVTSRSLLTLSMVMCFNIH